MNAEELERIVAAAKCRVFGWEDAGNDAHRQALGDIIRSTESPMTSILCEPSLTRSTTRPPDIVIVCPVRGVAVLEVKGFTLDAIHAIEPGGGFVLHYAGGGPRAESVPSGPEYDVRCQGRRSAGPCRAIVAPFPLFRRAAADSPVGVDRQMGRSSAHPSGVDL